MTQWLNPISAIQNAVASFSRAKSNWGSLHPNLIARFTQVGLDGEATGVAFEALIKDGSVEQTFEWQSPFEDFSADKRHPKLLGFVQTGGMEQLAQALGLGGNEENKDDSKTKALADWAAEKGTGRTGITKINSRQVFTGHAPLKIDATLVLRAWADPQSEVAAPFDALLSMAYPPKMAETAFEPIQQEGLSVDSAAEALFPSQTPLLVRLTYKGERYPLMVIESLGKPLDAPYSPMGDIWLEVPISLASWHSLDYQDIQAARLGLSKTEAIDAVNSLF